MNDMSSVIIPKSDQINADDLIAGPMTITIRDVQIKGGQEQPVSIYFDGSEKAFRPCKSMSRVLVQAWGADAKTYIGRSLTLYRDPTVKWGGLEVGGIRISHMSDIDGVKQMMLTATKGSRKPHRVMPLVMQPPVANQGRAKAEQWLNGFIGTISLSDVDETRALFAKSANPIAKLERDYPDLHEKVMQYMPSAEGNAPATADTSDPFDESSSSESSPTSTTSTTATTDASPSDEPHPAIAKADELITEIKAADAIMDVNSIMSRNRLDIAAMPDPIAESIQNAADQRKDAIKAEREKAGVAA